MVVFYCTCFRGDHIEQLLDFRKEYREHNKRYGRKHADRFARKQAIRWIACTIKEAAVQAVIIGKRIFLG